MSVRRLFVISILCLAILACNLTAPSTPAAPTAGETPVPLPTATSPAPAETTVPAAGRTFYVAPNGDNANPGTREQPWATPGYGSRQLAPGDTLIILGGRYTLREYDADILTPPSGTPAAWITIRGEEGHRPVLAGREDLLTAINLSGVQYVRVENLEITHDDTATGEAAWFREGVEILGAPSAHIVLKDLYIHHIDEFGINIQDVEDLQIINCRVEYCGFGALGGPAGEHGGWRDVTIRGCSLSWSGHYYQGGDGSNRPYDRPDGFGIEPSQGPILIEDTIAEHNYGDGLDSKAANTVIRRAVVANNACDGVKLWGPDSRIENTLIYGRGDGNPEPSPWAAIVIAPEEQANAHFEIINVTVDDALGRNYLMYVQYDHPDVPAHLTIRNTIFSGRGEESPIYVNAASTLIADHNLFYLPQNEVILTHGDTAYTCADIASLGPGNLCGDPRFVRPAWGEPGDYHLQAGSPAIDAGTANGAPTADLENRPRDAQPDIGAYEYPSATSRLFLPYVLRALAIAGGRSGGTAGQRATPDVLRACRIW
ncbi:MAG: hypothetical protein H5T61_03135 [Thermoflexales bacterium]|nr:hypothetical protein [Thermoflexales bacterium]